MAKQRKDQVPYQLKNDTNKLIKECQKNFTANTGMKLSKCEMVHALICHGRAVWDSVKKTKKKGKK